VVDGLWETDPTPAQCARLTNVAGQQRLPVQQMLTDAGFTHSDIQAVRTRPALRFAHSTLEMAIRRFAAET